VTGPRVGEASDEYRAVCVYSPEPGMPQCDKPATLHVRVEDKTYGEVALATCDEHVGTARAAGRFVQEHAFKGFCGFPSSLWVLEHNLCVLDDSGVSGLKQEKQMEMIS
jgi:hypothetical protein